MKSKDQLMMRATAIAEGHFYSDDECIVPWQPFEDWPRSELQHEAKMLKQIIYKAMIWAQEAN